MTMNDLTIERDIVIDAPVAVVWRTITEPDLIAQWFADEVHLDARRGGEGLLVFRANASTHPVTVALAVESVEPPSRFSFRWGQPEGAAASPQNSVLVEFTLTEEGSERTRLRVVETGLELVSWSEDEKSHYVDDHRHGWGVHLGRLEQALATSEG
jgi:uncharacterized protein YndB with AHSA1/START domain